MTLFDPAPTARPGILPDASLDLVLTLAALAEGVDAERLAHRARGDARVAGARHLAIYLAHVTLGWPVSRLADAFGRERASVRHALHRVEDLRDDPTVDRRIARLEAALARFAEIATDASQTRGERNHVNSFR